MSAGDSIYSRRVHFIWADWGALVVGLAFSLFLLMLLLVDFLAAGSAGASHLVNTLGTRAIELNFLVAGVVWACLRGVDYIIRASYRVAREGLKRAARQAARVMRPGAPISNLEKASISR
jgi:hypothetical protein